MKITGRLDAVADEERHHRPGELDLAPDHFEVAAPMIMGRLYHARRGPDRPILIAIDFARTFE